MYCLYCYRFVAVQRMLPVVVTLYSIGWSCFFYRYLRIFAFDIKYNLEASDSKFCFFSL